MLNLISGLLMALVGGFMVELGHYGLATVLVILSLANFMMVAAKQVRSGT